MLKWLDRVFVTSAFLTFLALVFFDAIFQTTGHLSYQEMIEKNQLLTSAVLTPFQEQALSVLTYAFPISVVCLWITGLLTWSDRQSSQNRESGREPGMN